jgi:hypothetical protein
MRGTTARRDWLKSRLDGRNISRAERLMTADTKRFHYHTKMILPTWGQERIDAELLALGEGGWEMTACVKRTNRNPLFIFKKEAEQ